MQTTDIFNILVRLLRMSMGCEPVATVQLTARQWRELYRMACQQTLVGVVYGVVKQMDDVLHTACADFVHQLPQGIDTMLHERGGRLSEGQSQRIAIARGLLRPGSVLLLDEISASLDEHTERKLMTRIRERYPHKTFICITHRRSVAASFEHVLQC